MFTRGLMRTGMATATGGAALYYCVRDRRTVTDTTGNDNARLHDARVNVQPRLPMMRVAACEGGDGSPDPITLLKGLAAVAVGGGLLYYLSTKDSDFDYASTPILDKVDGSKHPEFVQAQKAQATGNMVLAFNMYKAAADLGCVQAMTAVGAFYEDETIDFVQQDSAEAFRWYEKAAKKGEVDAMVRLGMMYDVGIEPVEKDMVKANKLFAIAADRGDPDAMFYLAWGYCKGEGGLSKNEAKGRELLEEASARGHERAKLVLDDMNRQQNGQ